jgi:hypothetical protein
MKKTTLTWCVLPLVFLVDGCQSKDHATAIRDFPVSLQPYLTKVVTEGVVGPSPATSYIEDHATDSELTQLVRSEHPILRATAVKAMLWRKTFNHFAVLMGHLSDTAIIPTDAGEWGVANKRVSDDLIESARWKTAADKIQTVDEIILHHDYLHAAYTGLRMVKLSEKYYSHIRVMAKRDRLDEEIEDALFALASYKRQADIPFIKETLFKLNSFMTTPSFRLMQEYPDTAYMQVLEYYYNKHRFYRGICQSESYTWTTGQEFLQTVASYRSVSSARILKDILDRQPFCSCRADTNTLKETLLRAIWANPCPAYAGMLHQIKPKMEALLKSDSLNHLSIDQDSGIAIQDDKEEPIRW